MFFATLLDKNYISRAEVMINSLFNCVSVPSKLFVLGLDETVIDHLIDRDNIIVINTDQIKSAFPELKEALNNRSWIEYVFTLSPFLPLYVLNHYPYIDRITTLDADLFFYQDPKRVLGLLGTDMIGITPHAFPSESTHLNQYGLYNVSFQSFPNTDLGIDCLRKWGKDCIDYCSDHLDEKGRFADQKYLDNWQNAYPGYISVFDVPEIGLAPWNIGRFTMRLNENVLIANGTPVIFYHFHRLRISKYGYFTTGLERYGFRKYNRAVKRMYADYYKKLLQWNMFQDEHIARYRKDTDYFWGTLIQDLKQKPIWFNLWGRPLVLNIAKFLRRK